MWCRNPDSRARLGMLAVVVVALLGAHLTAGDENATTSIFLPTHSIAFRLYYRR
jgi:hypothetical protein